MTRCDTTPILYHSLYCRLCGFDLPWRSDYLFPWEKVCCRFSQDDLKLVIKFIQEKQRMKKPARSLNFRTFIAGPSSLNDFAFDLSEARARARQSRPTARDRVLEATGRTPQVTHTAQTPDQIMRTSEALRNLLQLRDSL
jgi:hypothetical protein